ncbi:MAG: hypothetical protein FWE61_06355 [Micrococcales bacterium]|nr:hypothetical protein [Micrococcales bacterium]
MTQPFPPDPAYGTPDKDTWPADPAGPQDEVLHDAAGDLCDDAPDENASARPQHDRAREAPDRPVWFRRRTKNPPTDVHTAAHSHGPALDKTVAGAVAHALQLGAPHVGTEHLLLALLDDGGAAHVLERVGVAPDDLRNSLLASLPDRAAHEGQPALAPRARKALALATKEGGSASPGPPHLLLGLIREQQSLAAQVLTEAGLSLHKLRSEVTGRRGTPTPVAADTSAAWLTAMLRHTAVRVVLRGLAVPAWLVLAPVALVAGALVVVTGVITAVVGFFSDDDADPRIILTLAVLLGVVLLFVRTVPGIVAGTSIIVAVLLVLRSEDLAGGCRRLGRFILGR